MKRHLFLLLCFFLFLVPGARSSVTLILPHTYGQQGAQVTVPVKVKDFNSIVSVQGSIQFDPAIINFVSVQDFGLSGMMPSAFGTTQAGNGTLTFSWLDVTLVGNTLPDSSVIFSIIFTITGTAGQTSPISFSNTPVVIEIINSSFNPETLVAADGSAEVQNQVNPTVISFYMDSVTGAEGTQVTASLRAAGFINIISVQGTIQWDTSVATYSGISFYGLPFMNAANFSTILTGAGKLSFSWIDMSLNGFSLPDNSPLFTIAFDLVGSPGSTTPLGFATVPAAFEVTDSNLNSLNCGLLAGQLSITGLPVINTITVYCDSAMGPAGTQVVVSMFAGGFSNIVSMQGTLQFDTAVAVFDSLVFYGLPGMAADNFGMSLANAGKLMYAWFDMTLAGITVPASMPLFSMRFTLTGSPGSSTPVAFINVPAAQEYMDSAFSVLADSLISGLISIIEGNTLTIADPADLTYCPGDPLQVDYTASGTFLPGNLFILQLSDPAGSFVSPLDLDTIYSLTSGAFNTIVPQVITPGSAYRLRVISGSPFLQSASNPGLITILAKPVAPVITINMATLISSYSSGNQWYFNGSSIAGATGQSYILTQNGFYFVIYTGANGCRASSDTIHVVWVGTENHNDAGNLYVFPNPNNGVFEIKLPGGKGEKAKLSVYTILGQRIFETELVIDGTTFPVEMKERASGIYVMQVIVKGLSLRRKIVVR